MSQQRRFVTKGVFTLRTFAGLTVHMTFNVFMQMGLIYEFFMTISTKKVDSTWCFLIIIVSSQRLVSVTFLRTLFTYYFLIFVLIQHIPLQIVFSCTLFIALWYHNVQLLCMLPLHLEEYDHWGHGFVINSLVVCVAKLLLPESSVFVRFFTLLTVNMSVFSDMFQI